ncbi:MAG: TspO/MBR family protein [Noviherbaspirillum sp.]
MTAIARSTQVFGLLAWLALCFSVAALGALASVNAAEFYQQLQRPSWAPPGWLFGPVWSALYLSMGVAAWLAWRERGLRGLGGAAVLFFLQLAVNALWSWLFFAWREGGLAFAEVLILLALIAATVVAFWRIRPLAGVLLLPYLIWVGFASALNFATWQLNPQLLG